MKSVFTPPKPGAQFHSSSAAQELTLRLLVFCSSGFLFGVVNSDLCSVHSSKSTSWTFVHKK